MAGSTDSVGVVQQPGPVAKGRLVASTPARRRRNAGFPWKSTRKYDVPWEARTYVFSWADGGLTILDEEWNIQKDGFGRVQGYTHSRCDNVNMCGYPEMTYKQAKACEEVSAKTGCSLKVAFGKTFPLDQLNKDQLQRIALAPELFAPAGNEEQIAQSNRDIIAQFEKDSGVSVG